MGKSCVMTTTSLLLLFLFLQTLKYVHAATTFMCYGDFSTGKYGLNRDQLFSSLPSKVITNDGFYNASLGRDSDNHRVHVAALCGRGYDKQACQTCLGHVIEYTKSMCPNHTESFSWVTEEFDDVLCSIRYTNHSTFGKLELSPSIPTPNTDDIDSTKNMTRLSQEWMAMVNRMLEVASTAESSSVLKYYNASITEFTDVPDVYALMQCTPDLSPSDCKRCLIECVVDFQKQSWGKQGGAVGRPSCYFRWDFSAFYNAFGNVTRVLAPPRPPEAPLNILNCGKDKKCFEGRNLAFIMVPTIINIFIFVGIFLYWKRKFTHTGIQESFDSKDRQSMLRFDLGTILIATNDFSPENKLGQGGFGSVYKGILPTGKEIAAKRLTRGSGQGAKEFKNEVLLMTRLHHRNLVKLLGFCNEGKEEILVYEFVLNSSLDHFIFDEDKRRFLTWDVRYKIIEGVARGLHYLHEDSELMIIHRDLKASNILLDAEMNPKVADFGMARLFNMDQTQGETSRLVGTFGYMAPEYVTYGQFSAKSDVYSFGVMLLELISCKTNKNLEQEEEEEGLPSFVWKRWVEGRSTEIIDPLATPCNEISINQVMKLVHIGLLCVQENVSKRPTINSILIWLGSDDATTTTMPVPTPAAFLMLPSQSSSLPMAEI